MTIFSSGISMYAMGMLFQQFLGWDINVSIILAAPVVLGYTFLGGLTSSIYNEVLQFFLIVFGFLPLSLLGLQAVGWWPGLQAKLAVVAVERGFAPGVLTETGRHQREPVVGARAGPVWLRDARLRLAIGPTALDEAEQTRDSGPRCVRGDARQTLRRPRIGDAEG